MCRPASRVCSRGRPWRPVERSGGGAKVGAGQRSNRTQTARENLQQRGLFFAGPWVPDGGVEAVRAELFPQFSSVWCAIVANNNKSGGVCSGAVFLLMEKQSRRRCRVHGAGSGGGGGGPGTPSHPGERRGFLPADLLCALRFSGGLVCFVVCLLFPRRGKVLPAGCGRDTTLDSPLLRVCFVCSWKRRGWGALRSRAGTSRQSRSRYRYREGGVVRGRASR